MPRYRNALPQMNGSTFLSDGGMETTLIFLEGAQLPHLRFLRAARRRAWTGAAEALLRELP